VIRRGVLRVPFALISCALPIHAAFLHCIVVDNDTGRALARTAITIEALQGGQTVSRNSQRTDRNGAVTFGPLADGAYLITASRPAFATQQFGQKGWNLAGRPLVIQGDQPVAVNLRLRRLPSISGTVWDENQVGVANAPVVVYAASRPVKVATRVTTDDRGMFRAGELPPGTYVVRNAAKQFDDTLSVLPTFYPDGNALSQARVIEIDLDRSATDVNFQPAQGRLFRIAGRVNAPLRGITGAVDLISDTGRTSAGFDEAGNFAFEAVAPGTYDLFAQVGRYAGWMRLPIDRSLEGLRLDLNPMDTIRLSVAERANNQVDARAVAIFARRKDLDGDGPVIPLVNNRTQLTPGNWEIAVSTAPNLYPAAVYFMAQPASVTPASRADGWTPVQIRYPDLLKVVVALHPAALHGRVTQSLSEPAANAPVFLETLDIDPNEPPQVRTTRTDSTGIYRFAGLPPGRYRVFSSYDVDPTNRNSIDSARPAIVSLRESSDESQDLPLTN
jgi:hypothetical protein